jgi:hypothetical protein
MKRSILLHGPCVQLKNAYFNNKCIINIDSSKTDDVILYRTCRILLTNGYMKIWSYRAKVFWASSYSILSESDVE